MSSKGFCKKQCFIKVSQNGSHIKMKNKNTGKIIIVPYHTGDLKKGLEMEIRRKAGLDDEN